MVHKNILHYQSATNRIRSIHVGEGRKKGRDERIIFFRYHWIEKEIYNVYLPRERENQRERETEKRQENVTS
jgi:hypothetical protein